MDDAGKEHKITNITLHPDYEGRSEYDVAILQVKNPFAWNQIIKIAPPSYNPDEGDATIVGWGKNEVYQIKDNLFKTVTKLFLCRLMILCHHQN